MLGFGLGGLLAAVAAEGRPRPTGTGTRETEVSTVAGAEGGGRSRRTIGETDRDRTTAENGQGRMIGEAIERGLTIEGTTDRGPTTGGAITETNDQSDLILEGCLRARRPAGIQSKTAGTRLAELEAIELLRPRRRTATTVPSAMPADRSQSLSAEDR